MRNSDTYNCTSNLQASRGNLRSYAVGSGTTPHDTWTISHRN
jgi:hypothetical protein